VSSSGSRRGDDEESQTRPVDSDTAAAEAAHRLQQLQRRHRATQLLMMDTEGET